MVSKFGGVNRRSITGGDLTVIRADLRGQLNPLFGFFGMPRPIFSIASIDPRPARRALARLLYYVDAVGGFVGEIRRDLTKMILIDSSCRCLEPMSTITTPRFAPH
jgi:hypothetical protein